MDFNGEIVFVIADDKNIEVDFGTEILPTKIVHKGDVVALEKKSSQNRWIYKIEYDGEKEYLESLEKMLNQLCHRRKYVNQLSKIYEEVSITIYVRSIFGQVGFSLPNRILKKLALLDCAFWFDILSFGMVEDEE